MYSRKKKKKTERTENDNCENETVMNFLKMQIKVKKI